MNSINEGKVWRKISRLFLITFFLFAIGHALFAHKLNVFWSDSEAYYMYLPAFFIYGNFSDVKVFDHNQFQKNEVGNYEVKVTAGVAILQLPLFLIAHSFSLIFDALNADGYSRTYEWSVQFSTALMAFIGLFYLRKILLRDYYPIAVLLTLLFLVFGTNFFHYTIFESGMSHVYCFALFTWSLHCFILLCENQSRKNTFIYGVSLALALFIRPTNVFFLPFLFGFGLTNWNAFSKRLRLLLKHFWKFTFFVWPLMILVAIQVGLWSESFGSLTFYSYSGERFLYVFEPKFWQVLVNPRTGLLLYTPVFILIFMSLLYQLFSKKWMLAIPGLITILSIFYLVASWQSWHYAYGFGHRAFTEWLVVLMFPLAFFINTIWQRNNHWLKMTMIVLCVIMGYYSIAFDYFYMKDMFATDRGYSYFFAGLKSLLFFE